MRRRTLGRLIAELAGPWMAAEEARLREWREHGRLRAAGAGPGHELVFTNRVIVTLVYLRLQLPHAALAELYRIDRSTISRAVGEIRPLLAARGFAVPGEPGIRLRTLADVFACAAAHAKLTIAQSHSRPHVSNDNPYSESAFKTLKYCPPSLRGSAPSRTRTSSAAHSSPITTTSTGTPASRCTLPPPSTTTAG